MPGITQHAWSGIALLLLPVVLILLLIYHVAYRAIVNEVRHQAMAVAMAIAKTIDPDDLESIRGPQDMGSVAYQRIAALLGDIERTNPDVRYVYTMRRTSGPQADPLTFEYIVDAPSRDANGDGIIGRAEMSEPPGKPYSAALWPAMQAAWNHPTADEEPIPDPPYPDLLSGYAPVRNRRGQTVAIVGADITAETIARKMTAVRAVIIPTGVLLCLILVVFVRLYYRQQEAIYDLYRRGDELSRRNEILRAANRWFAEQTAAHPQADQIARTVQMGLLPGAVAERQRIAFDTFYIACDMAGGDLYDVFDVDDDHVAMFMADVAGHGTFAAMVGGLLKSALASERPPAGYPELKSLMTDPARMLAELNQLLHPELPPKTFVTMVYAVFNIPRCSLSIASAGHPPPLRFAPEEGSLVPLSIPIGPALGPSPEVVFTYNEKSLRRGDRLIFYSDGIPDAVDSTSQTFGVSRLMEAIRRAQPPTPAAVVERVLEALQQHRGAEPLRDDCSLLVAEIR